MRERAPEFGEVGAGLAITGNGMTALGALGAADAVRAAGPGAAVSRCPCPLQRQYVLARGDPGYQLGCDLGGGWRQSVRNAMLRLAPPKILMRAGTRVVDWTAP